MTRTFAVPWVVEAMNGGLFVSPGFGTHAVRVIDSYELIFVTRGRLDIFEGERSFHLSPGQTLLLHPHIRHGGLEPYARDANFYWAHFRLRNGGAPGGWLSVPKVATVRDPERLTELFCRFVSDQESGIADVCSAGQLIELMLATIAQPHGGARAPRSRQTSAPRVSLADAVRRSIDTSYLRPISTSEIAKELGYNPDYLERIFRRREGVSIVDALHRKRIAEARAALNRDVRRNINEIAFQCGYADPGYFRRMFKRLTGLTPREFRSLYARTHINTH